MAYIINSIRKINLKFQKKKTRQEFYEDENRIFIFVLLLSAIVCIVDYALVIKFMEIIKNI